MEPMTAVERKDFAHFGEHQYDIGSPVTRVLKVRDSDPGPAEDVDDMASPATQSPPHSPQEL